MEIVRAIAVLAGLTIITGVLYPLAVTGIGGLFFARQMSGSLLMENEKIAGSELIGQAFESSEYFWGRPSGTAPVPYNGAAGSGTNLAPSNPELLERVRRATDRLLAAQAGKVPVPVDLVTSSGSGLDPHISVAAAEYQVSRVATARRLTEDKVRQLVRAHIEERLLGIVGERRINVLLLNRALDKAVRP